MSNNNFKIKIEEVKKQYLTNSNTKEYEISYTNNGYQWYSYSFTQEQLILLRDKINAQLLLLE